MYDFELVFYIISDVSSLFVCLLFSLLYLSVDYVNLAVNSTDPNLDVNNLVYSIVKSWHKTVNTVRKPNLFLFISLNYSSLVYLTHHMFKMKRTFYVFILNVARAHMYISPVR